VEAVGILLSRCGKCIMVKITSCLFFPNRELTIGVKKWDRESCFWCFLYLKFFGGYIKGIQLAKFGLLSDNVTQYNASAVIAAADNLLEVYWVKLKSSGYVYLHLVTLFNDVPLRHDEWWPHWIFVEENE